MWFSLSPDCSSVSSIGELTLERLARVPSPWAVNHRSGVRGRAREPDHRITNPRVLVNSPARNLKPSRRNPRETRDLFSPQQRFALSGGGVSAETMAYGDPACHGGSLALGAGGEPEASPFHANRRMLRQRQRRRGNHRDTPSKPQGEPRHGDTKRAARARPACRSARSPAGQGRGPSRA